MILITEAREKASRQGESALHKLEARIDEALVQFTRYDAWPLRVELRDDQERTLGRLLAHLYREIGWNAEASRDFFVVENPGR